MSVGRICTRIVVTASPRESVRVLARRMEDLNVGTVVVADEAGAPVAIVTDRDVVLRCVAPGLDPQKTTVGEIMTRGVKTVPEDAPIDQAVRTMASAGTRRLAVTGEGGRLVGVLSLDDVVQLLAEEAESIGRLLSKGAPELTTWY